nr:MAG TPA: hypothetical protein [Caudoviricetes sp.]
MFERRSNESLYIRSGVGENSGSMVLFYSDSLPRPYFHIQR